MTGLVAADATWIFVTGSRFFGDDVHVWRVLDGELDRFGSLVVVHGDNPNPKCPDNMAKRWAKARREEGRPAWDDPHPADWEAPCRPPSCRPGHRKMRYTRDHQPLYLFCPAAGVYRNHDMIDKRRSRLVLGHAFYQGSRGITGGTFDCATYATVCGVPVQPWVDRQALATQLTL